MSEQSFLAQATNKSLIFALMLIPTAISIFVAIEVKNMTTIAVQDANGEPQIVCFNPDVCAIEVQGNWYRISGVIKMDETVPDEYRLNELVETIEQDKSAETIDNQEKKYEK